MIQEILFYSFASLGVIFFTAGTIGLIRFHDLYSRLHALTKADNLGLGFLALALFFYLDWSEDFMQAFKIMLIWLLVLLSSGTNSHLIAKAAHENKLKKEAEG